MTPFLDCPLLYSWFASMSLHEALILPNKKAREVTDSPCISGFCLSRLVSSVDPDLGRPEMK